MAIDFPNSPAPNDNFTVSGKTWTFTDGKWALNVGVGGVQGPAGIAIQGTAPATTDVLWADTSVSGVAIVPAGGTTGQMLAKSSSTSYDTAWATPVTSGDLALKANLASPPLTGTPTSTTAAPGTNNTQIATTAYVDTADALKANLASPTFTGTPTLPSGTIATTQTAGDNTTAVATTAFVSALGQPVAFTPVFSGLLGGNPTSSGTYIQIGKLVWFRARWKAGSTATAYYAFTFTLPVTGTGYGNVTGDGASIKVFCYDDSAGIRYDGNAWIVTNTALYPTTGATHLTVSASTPFVWQANDYIDITGTYIAA